MVHFQTINACKCQMIQSLHQYIPFSFVLSRKLSYGHASKTSKQRQWVLLNLQITCMDLLLFFKDSPSLQMSDDPVCYIISFVLSRKLHLFHVSKTSKPSNTFYGSQKKKALILLMSIGNTRYIFLLQYISFSFV